MKSSTYYFIGTISDKSSGFQVQDVKLKDGTEFSIFLDGIVAKKVSTESFNILRASIKESIEILVSAVVLQTNQPLSFSWQSWVEAKDADISKDVVGWFGIPVYLSKNVRSQRSPVNKPWKQASKLYDLLQQGNGNHVLALKDFRSAIMDEGADSFLFAYRAVEDICRSITGKEPQESWSDMHKVLGTKKEEIEPLTLVSECVRHGDITNQRVKTANRAQLLGIAQDVIKKEIKRSFKLDI